MVYLPHSTSSFFHNYFVKTLGDSAKIVYLSFIPFPPLNIFLTLTQGSPE